MEKKWALVTGASSGIGLAYAEELASRGYQLVIVSNEEQAIREKGEFLSEKYGIEVLPLYRDLAIPGAAKELYDTCQEKNIPIEVLVNNAGMFFFCETLQAKANIVEKMLYLHVTTPTQLCYYFGQEMKKRRHGYILNMSSLSCWLPYPGITLYASTKRYLKSFSRGDSLKTLAIRLGIMMRPEKLAKKGINALFHHRASLLPGLFNKICTPLVMLLPHGLVRWIMRTTKLVKLDR